MHVTETYANEGSSPSQNKKSEGRQLLSGSDTHLLSVFLLCQRFVLIVVTSWSEDGCPSSKHHIRV